jgi:hypothetical protein
VSWDEFALAWSEAFDGYDLRQASTLRQRFMRAIYQVTGVVKVRTSVTMLISVVFSISVPLLAWRGGQWPAIAALLLLLGQVADAMTTTMAVRSGRVTQLESFYQALVERFAEVCWLLTFLALGARPLPVMLTAVVVWAHEYVRAKVGGAVMRRAGSATVGDRSLRIWLVLVALVLAAAVSVIGQDMAAGIVTMVVLCWLALGLIGLAQLLAIIRKALA